MSRSPVSASDESLAKAIAEKVMITDTLLEQGYYSAAADLSHNDAEMALKPFEGKTTKGKTYVGAFMLPHQGDSNPATTLSGFERSLRAYKAKIEDDTIKLPVTLQFLINTPGEKSPTGTEKSTSGHDTILEVALKKDKGISFFHIDSLLEAGSTSPSSAWVSANEKHIRDVVITVFGAIEGVTPEKSFLHLPSPVGKQTGIDCVYFAVGLIAGEHTTEPENKEYVEPEARKLAVVKLMAQAAYDQYYEIHKDEPKFLITEVVDKTKLKIAKAEDLAAYQKVAPDMKVGDIIYPPVLKKLAPEKTVSTTAKENGDVLKEFDETAKTAVMKTVFEQVKAVVAKNWMNAEYPTVTFELAKKKDDADDDITVSDSKCKVHLIATFTKKDGAEEKAHITLTRTTDPANPGEVVRCCQTKSALVTWPMQCELMANQSMTERQAAAKKAGVKADTRIMLSIEDNSAKTVSAKDLGGATDAKLTPKEADLVKAYFAAGYTEVYCAGVRLQSDGMVSKALKEGTPSDAPSKGALPGVLSSPPLSAALPSAPLSDVSAPSEPLTLA